MEDVTCERCRTVNPATASFCNGCGAALEPRAVEPGSTSGAAPSGWALATAEMDAAPEPERGDGPLRKAEVASWWARLGGSMLDSLIFFVVLLMVGGGIGVVAYLVDPQGVESMFERLDEELTYGTSGATDGSWFWLMLFGLAIVGLYVAWEVAWLRSPKHMARPGQSIAGFRVVAAESVTPLGTGRAIGRFGAKLLYNVPNLGTILTFVTAFTIGLTNRRQGIHDMIAGTACVRKDALARRGIGPDARQGAWLPQHEAGMAAARVAASTMGDRSAPQSPPSSPPPGPPPGPPPSSPPPSGLPPSGGSGSSGPFV